MDMIGKQGSSNFEIKKVPESLKTSYLPSLNGVRGIAIILVIMSHLRLSSQPLYYALFNGDLGVNFFFVLSGFLITTLCLKEKVITGDLSLKNFYLRRILRIFPLGYLYLLVILILNYWLNLQIPAFQFLGAAVFILNLSYFRKHDLKAPIGHYWSLATEEQFYLILPGLLKWNYRGFYYSIIFIVFILPILCTIQSFWTTANIGIFYVFTHVLIKFQGISVGCFASIISFKYAGIIKCITKHKLLFNISALSLIFFLQFNFFYTLTAVYINLLISLLIAYVILSNITLSNDFVFKLLNFRPLRYIGVLSYSIYIWQQIFTMHQPWVSRFKYSDSLVGNILALIVVAYISYNFYERPFLKLKQRFKRIQ